MPGPSLVDYQTSVWSDTTAAGVNETTTAGITWQTGDYIVAVGATEDSGVTLGVPARAGLTFSQVDQSAGASNGNTYIWDATAAGSGSGTVTCSKSGGGTTMSGLAVFVFRGSDGRGATNKITGGNVKVISLARANDNSGVVVVLVDWAAINDTTVTPDPSSGGTQRHAVWVLNQATMFLFNWTDQGAAATTNFGVGSHTGTVDMVGIALEVKGTPPVTTREQEGFRFRNDDGDEDGASWKANQDTNITAPKLTNTRLRILTDTTTVAAPSEALKLQWRKDGDPDTEWRDVT